MPFNGILREFHYHPGTVTINCVGGFGGNCNEIGDEVDRTSQGSRIGFVCMLTLLTTAAIAQEGPVKLGVLTVCPQFVRIMAVRAR